MLRAVIVLLVLLIPSVAQAEDRFALLIGNQSYSGKVQPLKSPHNDIGAVGQALASVGFKVTTLPDAGRRQMLSAVKNFAADLAKVGPEAIGFSTIRAMGSPAQRITQII